MGEQVTLVADVGSVTPSGLMGYDVRPVELSDRDALGLLYFESYDPGAACETLQEAVDDIQASFEGEYGRLLEEASLVAVEDGSLVGAVLTVHRAPWEGLPDSPLVIEIFVDRAHRRRGIARGLMTSAMAALQSLTARRVSLRVGVDNRPARDLYESLGFAAWSVPK